MQKTQVTIKHIAQALNISISTVSRALQNHPRIGLRTKEKVFEMAQRLNYVPNPAAILLKKNKTYTIGVVLPHLQEEFFSQAITAIEDVISAENYNVVVSQSRDKLERENRAIKSFISSRVDGVIASISAETTQYYQFRELEKYGIPIVFFDRAPKDVAVNKVRGNIADAAFEVIDFLAKKGIKKVAILNGPASLEISDERLMGYWGAMKKFNLPIIQNYIKSTDLSKEDTTKKMIELLNGEELPEAVFCFNDYVALYAMQACKQKGLVPNKDIVFVSFANLPITTYLDNPPLASVEQFAYQMGEKAAQLLLKIIQAEKETLEPEDIVVNTKLIVH
ncbi:LacI family DNA-binding transcriptional regulator [Flectobacillus roseus]|uniref:LacI family DNA-binding transcriptional regulator n=1 Tax=Flectobacillus roseus TaxID=502259 RepID=A0ABT6Y9B2_9BACT|nr:LacI family DNA-binding transcriptional regulator [Flectobacillus roseus]MDI9859841.1 LacI family DNA-binding transcriptional regulator [Flectobacillus roseus]MDI9869997.1 LacI family DNA-binding transcriptional regulator [Flectobacillus roseus]NBA74529.1 substrate-binding domain-containing protein [Emticicia sp. ODNR4P]